MDVDGLTAAEPVRFRRPWLIAVAILPLALFAAAAGWFIRTYVTPPTVAIADRPMLASVEPTAAPPPRPETTGTSQQLLAPVEQPAPAAMPAPAAAPASDSAFPPPPQPAASVFPPPPAPVAASPWPAVATVATATPDTTPAAPAAEPVTADALPDAAVPVAEAVPLPRRRPRISLAVVRGPVPLPRPRPAN